MQLGEYRIDVLETGEFRLDGGAMFGVVPKVLWEKTNPADEQNRITLALRCLLLRGHGRTILVDTGIGEKWNTKQTAMFAIDHKKHSMDKALHHLDVERSDITDVVISHLHFDHVGGATRATKNGKIELGFPNATYFVHEANLAHAHAPTEKDKASFLRDNIAPLVDSGKLVTIKDGHEFAPHVTAWITHGHTPGQTLVRATNGRTNVLFCADTIPTASHIPLPYVMGYDLHPMTTIAEKKIILEKAAAEGWVLVFVHDPKTPACTVEFKDGKYAKRENFVF